MDRDQFFLPCVSKLEMPGAYISKIGVFSFWIKSSFMPRLVTSSGLCRAFVLSIRWALGLHCISPIDSILLCQPHLSEGLIRLGASLTSATESLAHSSVCSFMVQAGSEQTKGSVHANTNTADLL